MTETGTKSSAKEILQAFATLTSIAWTINPFLSFLPVLQTSKYPPVAHGSANPSSVHTLKHYLKNSNIPTLLKQGIQGPPTFHTRHQTRSSISASSLTHQIRLIHPDWHIIIDPYDGMLPSPCGWLLFSSPHIQRVVLANQLQTIFYTSSSIDTPLQCIWTNIQGFGDYQQSTAPAIQIKCHPSHKQAIQTLFLEIIFPTATDKEDPQYTFQRRMVFMTSDMLSITDAAYTSLLLDQSTFQAAKATLKVYNLCPLSIIITGSTDTLGTALTSLPDPTACSYLLCSIELSLFPENNTIFLCLNRQFSSNTSNLITSLYPTLALLYPEI